MNEYFCVTAIYKNQPKKYNSYLEERWESSMKSEEDKFCYHELYLPITLTKW